MPASAARCFHRGCRYSPIISALGRASTGKFRDNSAQHEVFRCKRPLARSFPWVEDIIIVWRPMAGLAWTGFWAASRCTARSPPVEAAGISIRCGTRAGPPSYSASATRFEGEPERGSAALMNWHRE